MEVPVIRIYKARQVGWPNPSAYLLPNPLTGPFLSMWSELDGDYWVMQMVVMKA